jgi:hypothetical protein
MDIISQVTTAMQTVLTTIADAAAVASGFLKRKRKLTGAGLVQTLVFGWLANPQSTYDELTQAAGSVGIEITRQGIEQRLTQSAAEMLKTTLDASAEQVIASCPQAIPLLSRFNGVYLQDSSWITLPDELCDVWSGCGTNTDTGGKASLKIQLRFEMVTGAFEHLSLTDGKTHDGKAQKGFHTLAAGSLRLADLGYFSLDELKALHDAKVFWLTRLKANCHLFWEDNTPLCLPSWLQASNEQEVDCPIWLGKRAFLPARLLAKRVSAQVANERRRQLRKQAKSKGRTPSFDRLALADWDIYITNIPTEELTVKQALVIARVRWQIELIFKLFKSLGQIDESRSQKPYRILCEVYAKLIAQIIQHWILLVGGWRYPEYSLVKAAKVVTKYALAIASAYTASVERLIETFFDIKRALANGCRISGRTSKPSTFQLLLETSQQLLQTP